MSKPDSPPLLILTVGHSNHPWPHFLELLENAGVGNVVDVRSSANSRHAHFSKPVLNARLNFHGICYEHLPELGGIRKGSVHRTYDEIGRSPEFIEGIERLLQASKRDRTAILCAEHDCVMCHRLLLVARALVVRGVPVAHIRRSGEIETQLQAETRLLQITKLDGEDLLASAPERLSEAYRIQEERLTGSRRPK